MVATTPPFSIKQNDLYRAIQIQCLDANGSAVDLTLAVSAAFKMTQNVPVNPKTVTGNAQIVTAASGILAYQWVAGDTTVVGAYRGEFTVTWPSNEPDTFPSDGWIDIEVYSKA